MYFCHSRGTSLVGLRLLGIGLAHVPVRDQLHAVGIGVRGEDDDVVQNAQRFGIVARHHLVDELHQLVRAQHLGGVQAAVDPHHRLAFVRQRVRLVVGEAFGHAPACARSPCSAPASCDFPAR